MLASLSRIFFLWSLRRERVYYDNHDFILRTIAARRLTGDVGFDKSKAPFQDFQILFTFRDDHVHDKVVPFSDDRARKRYNGRFQTPCSACCR